MTTSTKMIHALTILAVAYTFLGLATLARAEGPAKAPKAGQVAPAPTAPPQGLRTTRCDGKGPLKTPTAKPCRVKAPKGAKGVATEANESSDPGYAADVAILAGQAQLIGAR